MTLAEIVTELKGMISPANPVSDDTLKQWIYDAWAQMVDEVVRVVPDYFTANDTQNLTANTQEYDLPDDFEKVIMVNMAYDGSTWQRALPMPHQGHIPVQARTDSNQGFTQRSPQYYLFGSHADTKIGFMPIPDATVSDALNVWYVQSPTIELGDNDSPAVPVRYHRALKYWAFAVFLDQQDQHAAAERMRNRFTDMVDRMAENIQDQQIDEPRSVTITQNRDLYEYEQVIP